MTVRCSHTSQRTSITAMLVVVQIPLAHVGARTACAWHAHEINLVPTIESGDKEGKGFIAKDTPVLFDGLAINLTAFDAVPVVVRHEIS